MVALVGWLGRNVRGANWGTYRCEKWGPHEASLHAENRAVDWHLDVRVPADRAAGRALIELLLAPDRTGLPHALARRMGVEEIIWDCSYWGAGMDDFKPYSVCLNKLGERAQARRPDRRPPRPPAHRDVEGGRGAADVVLDRGGRRRRLDLLDQHRHPLADADAQRREAAGAALALEAPEQADDEADAARAERMAERDRAALGVDRVLVEAEAPDAGDDLRRERLVDLDRVEVGDGPARCARGPSAVDGTGPRPMMCGGTPAEAVATTRPRGVRPCASTARSLATTIAPAPSDSGDALPAVTMPPRRNDGLSFASASIVVFGRGTSSSVSAPSLSGTSTRSAFAVLGRRRGALLRAQAPRVGLLARDAVEHRDLLGRVAEADRRLAAVDVAHARVHEAPAERRVGHLRRRAPAARGLRHDDRRARHRLDAARDDDVGLAGADLLRRRRDRLQARRAQPVHGVAGDLVAQAREEDGHARDVAVVLARLVGGAVDDLVDRVAGDARRGRGRPRARSPRGRRGASPRAPRGAGRTASARRR